MTGFDWRTDEEQGWDQLPEQRRPPAERRPSWQRASNLARSHWRSFLIALLLLAAISALGARTIALRVAAAEAAARDDVLATYALLLDAAANQDAELFVTLLGGDRAWRQEQLDAFEHNAFFGRDAMGMDWQSDVEPTTTIKLSPNLQQALITGTLRYEGYAGAGQESMFDLRHTLQYGKDGDRWRLEPHDLSHWSGWSTFENGELETVFPGRDETLGERLSQDLRAGLNSICGTSYDCPASFHVQLRFELNSETFHTPSLWINRTRAPNYSLSLPAPSLVGLPVGDVAYRALRAAYLRTIVDQLFDSIVRPRSAATNELRNALRRQLFADLDLIVWPPNRHDETEMLSEGSRDILAVCAASGGRGASLLRYDAMRGDWLTELQGRNFTRLVGIDGIPGVILRESVGETAPSVERPSRLTWWSDGQELARFDGFFLGDTVPASPAFIAGTPDGQNYWIYLGNADACDGRTCDGLVVRDEPTTWSPDGQHTLFRRELEGSRSPPASDDVLWLGDGDGNTVRRLQEGVHPFWIDNETFGYLVPEGRRQQTFPFNYDLIIEHTDGQPAAKIVSLGIMDALAAWAPGDEDVEEMGIAVSHIFTHPAHPQTLYIVGVRFSSLIRSGPPSHYAIFLFAADMDSGHVTVRVPDEQLQWTGLPRLSANGRWLAYAAYDPENSLGAVTVHDLGAVAEQGTVYDYTFQRPGVGMFASQEAIPTYDWSPGDNRLLVLDQGVLHIVNPNTGAEQQLVPPTPACSHAAWAD